ncbi:MAG: ribulokinase, partial [Armatimonadetes bacterium]|nr:ribulokinase [Candidatus Hippobium faecium]
MYTIGLDYGTLSCRALLVNTETGEEVATSVYEYTDGVISEKLPVTDIKLGNDWALQNPDNYIEGFVKTVRDVLEISGIDPKDVAGMGIDFTACTMMPVDRENNVLCQLAEYKDNPHAWVKLWKHHAAQDEATYINEVAEKMGESWLAKYGGKVSSEWMFAKILQIFNEDRNIYDKADRFMEAGDWVVLQITGEEKRNACAAGYKSMWDKREGYPSKEFFKALNPEFENVIEEKMSGPVCSIGDCAGHLNEKFARLTGLSENVAVGVANVDAHVAVPAMTVTREGTLAAIMGTSSCLMLLGNEAKMIPGICGYVEDGILPGYIGFEAGQSCVGDHFDWFVKNCVPQSYYDEAKEKGISIHKLLREKSINMKPGESGLLALDWWNGNRSVLVDVDLTGMILGMNLNTKPEEIYRALIEATAYGFNVIIKNFEEYGVKIKDIVCCGGLADKDPMLMQIYADVTGKELKVAKSSQTCALGSAMWGAVAAGKSGGGYDTIEEACEKMAGLKDTVYRP